MSTTQDLIAMEEKYGARNYSPLDVMLSRGKGVWVWDIDGNRYLDCLSAYGAVNQGHAHPKILKTLIEQAERLSVVSRAFRTDQLAYFYKEICELTKSHLVLPMNSGAEAVETALKAVRKWAYEVKKVPDDQAEIIVCADNFHGRTISIIGFSTTDQFKKGFGPFPAGFKVVPFGDFEAFQAAITPRTAGFLVEPIQGEGGINMAPEGYFKKVRQLCSEKNIWLIFDEIQTGLGRTGRLLAEEHEGVEADVTLIGKSLGGGFVPISAVLSNEAVLGVFAPGDHGSTFGGNPLACAIARTSLRVLVEEDMIANSDRKGAMLKKEILGFKSPLVAGVRGRGLMLGIDLTPQAGDAKALCKKLMKHGMLCNKTGVNVLRISPPLCLSDEEANWILDNLRTVLLEA